MKLLKSKGSSQLAIGAAFLIVFNKLVVNEEAGVNSEFATSTAAYLVAGATLVFCFALIIPNIRQRLALHQITSLALLFYMLGLVFSLFSSIPIISAFRSISGILYILAAYYVAKKVAKNSTLEIDAIIYQVCATIGIAFIIGEILSDLDKGLLNAFLSIQAGSGALFIGYLSVWHFNRFLISNRTVELIKFGAIALLCAFLQSFSTLLSIATLAIFLSFINRRWLILLLIVAATLTSGLSFYYFLLENSGAVILGKSAGAYLIGSGRFQMYQIAIDAYINMPIIQKIIGVGFMAERDILRHGDLAWSTDVHNYLLSNLLGVGLIGLMVTLAYSLAPFLAFKKIKKGVPHHIATNWLSMHTLFLVYGMTSTSYFSQPSFQLLVFSFFSSALLGWHANQRSSMGIMRSKC